MKKETKSFIKNLIIMIIWATACILFGNWLLCSDNPNSCVDAPAGMIMFPGMVITGIIIIIPIINKLKKTYKKTKRNKK